MGFNLGGLVSGYQNAETHNADLRQKAMALKEMQLKLDQAKQEVVAQATAGAAGLSMGGDQGGPPQPPQGPQPPAMPQGATPGGPPQPTPMPGAQPMQPPMAAQPSPGGMPAGGGGPSGAPGPQGPGASPGQPPQPQVSGVAAPTGNYVQDQNRTLGMLYQSVKRANPNIKPGEAFQAVNALVGQIKGVAPEDRLILQAMVANQRLDHEKQIKDMQAQSARDLQTAKEEWLAGQNEANRQLKEQLAELEAQVKKYAADRGKEGRLGAAATSAGARVTAAGMSAGASNYRADKNLEGANVRAGATRDSAATKNAGAANTAEIRATKGKKGYGSPADVVAAYKSGKMTREQAAQVLKANGWAQ